ncbi:hypothetical protein OnM2_023066 [Erysiphe neolycopersici]|uniref:Uncharacterized protein n=1 Tax=Erysiphe neolycopersici TaxID=212602 RepID=A0A420I247_9PEZI|nr:hypothetical protein OnM2_023066 [Erysiphe neolycopersici]
MDSFFSENSDRSFNYISQGLERYIIFTFWLSLTQLCRSEVRASACYLFEEPFDFSYSFNSVSPAFASLSSRRTDMGFVGQGRVPSERVIRPGAIDTYSLNSLSHITKLSELINLVPLKIYVEKSRPSSAASDGTLHVPKSAEPVEPTGTLHRAATNINYTKVI